MPAHPPVHLVAGDDDHLLRRALERVLAGLRSADPDLEVDLLEASETPHLPDLRTASLFGSGRCVVLRGAEGLSGTLKDEVEEYLEAPDPDAVLVLVARGVGRIQRVARLAGEVGERTDVKAPASWDDRGWKALVSEEFAAHGRKAEGGAVQAVLAHAGSEPGVVASKVAQVVAATSPDRAVAAEDVERVVEGHGSRGGFAVADAVERRDPAGALVALRGNLEAGEEALALLGALIFRMRQLLHVRGGAGAQEVGVSPGRHRMLAQSARAFHAGELAWCHDRLARADLDLKGSDLPQTLVLELAVVDVATTRVPGPPWNPT